MNTNEFNKTIATEIISDLAATLIITRNNLIQRKKDAIQQARQLDKEIKRIEAKLGKDEIDKICGGNVK